MTAVRRIQWAIYLKTWPWNITATLAATPRNPWQTEHQLLNHTQTERTL